MLNNKMKLILVLAISIMSISLLYNQKDYPKATKNISLNETKKTTLTLTSKKKWVITNLNYTNINCKEYQPENMINNVILKATENKLTGMGPVNTFSSNYVIEDQSIKITKLLSTKKYGQGSCVETEFFTFLKSDLKYQFNDNQLILTSAKKNGIFKIYLK
tara:strand:+ start:2107 stop:2589 length:483 start_codon:yes stop_codon:yes gene_type:complete